MKTEYSIKNETSRPAGNFRDSVPLKRQWALVKNQKPYGYTVISRFSTKEAAEAALKNLTNG
jgi:hypothetical protein